MGRVIAVAAAQMGPVTSGEPRAAVVARMVDLLRESAARGADLVVFPEASLTPFFPHWEVHSEEELDQYFEGSMPNASVASLFDEAARLHVGLSLGYCERAVIDGVVRRFNSSLLVDRLGGIVGRYRKVHLPGYRSVNATHPFQNLEKRYFDVGDLGFPVWDTFNARVGLCICNDRRWPEVYRVMGLQGVELVLVGYNTPVHNPAMPETDSLAGFHSHLCMQAGAYQNGTWVVGVAKAGREEGVDQIGGTCIVAPSGQVVAQTTSLHDEVVMARCDLDLCQAYKNKIFNFAENRHPELYGLISEPSCHLPTH